MGGNGDNSPYPIALFSRSRNVWEHMGMGGNGRTFEESKATDKNSFFDEQFAYLNPHKSSLAEVGQVKKNLKDYKEQ